MSSFGCDATLQLISALQPLLDYEQYEHLCQEHSRLEWRLLGVVELLEEADSPRAAESLRDRCMQIHDAIRALEVRIESGLDYETRRELDLDRTHPPYLFPEPPRSSWA